MFNENVTLYLSLFSRDIISYQQGYNMTKLQVYNAKSSQPSMFLFFVFLQHSLLHFSPEFQLCILM